MVHISRVLGVHDQVAIHGIPTVIVPVCLLQIAEQSDAAMIKALEGTMRDGISPTWIRQVANRYDRPGRSAAKRVLRALDERVDGTLPRSWFQRLASRLLADVGIETVDEYSIHDGRRLLAQLIWRFLLSASVSNARAGSGTQRPRLSARRGPKALPSPPRLGDPRLWWSDLDRIDDVIATLAIIVAERQPG